MMLPVEVKGYCMERKRIYLQQGTLGLLILKSLAPQPQRGWAISERIGQVLTDMLSVRQGPLYPALHRPERCGWIRPKWRTSK